MTHRNVFQCLKGLCPYCGRNAGSTCISVVLPVDQNGHTCNGAESATKEADGTKIPMVERMTWKSCIKKYLDLLLGKLHAQ